MTNISELRKNTPLSLSSTSSIDEASKNLPPNEVASSLVTVKNSSESIATSRRRDGRSMRRTGRTVSFATRVSKEFDERIREIAERKGLMLVEVMERALAAYEKELTVL